jgi:hypothetical protein
MAAIAFDPLEYTHQLEASGVPREQAEVHAKAMTAMFLHNFDALVTKDYLESRFSEFETRVEATMDKRFAEAQSSVDKRFAEAQSSMDKQFAEAQSGMDKRFAEARSSMDKEFADFRMDVHSEFGKLRGEFGELKGSHKLHSWMLALLMAGIFMPMLKNLLP